MKQIRAFALTFLCAAALLVPRDARTVTGVNDSKNLPGSVCRVNRASYGWLDGANPGSARSSWPTTNNGFLSMGSTLLSPPGQWNGLQAGSGDWQEGTHPYVYSSVLCNLDIGTGVLGVHYSQVGGNSADW